METHITDIMPNDRNIIEYNEIWSIPEKRLIKYFADTYHAAFQGDQMLIGDVKVTVTPISPNIVMKVPIPRCQVNITGYMPDAEEVHRRFVMNFLSAGG